MWRPKKTKTKAGAAAEGDEDEGRGGKENERLKKERERKKSGFQREEALEERKHLSVPVAGDSPHVYNTTETIFLYCGSSENIPSQDGTRTWIGDIKSEHFPLHQSQNNASTPAKLSKQPRHAGDETPYMRARFSRYQFSYTFNLTPGPKFIRLHFYETSYQNLDRSKAFFSVTAGSFTLLSNFSTSLAANFSGQDTISKEFCVNVQENQILNITFSPTQDYKDSLAGPNPDPGTTPTTVAPPTSSNNRSSNRKIIISVVVGVVSILIAVSVVLLFIRRRKISKVNEYSGSHIAEKSRQFSLSEMKAATNNFDKVFIIGVGGFGNVYKGFINVGPTSTMSKAHVSTAVKGSFGYLDPEYIRFQRLTEKSDVYSFGVVLCEVMCAREPIIRTVDKIHKKQGNLARWARQCYDQNGTFDQIVDPVLKGKIAPQCLKKFCDVAMNCLDDEGIKRPSMSDVVWGLEFALQLQQEYDKLSGGAGNGICVPHLDDDQTLIKNYTYDYDSSTMFSRIGGHVLESRTMTTMTNSSSDDYGFSSKDSDSKPMLI
ncbi:hypothetical protein QYF36_012105 [Acer negundo]|nr:hypothetical protein QYF36_012105 [Acer negundo]